MNSLQHARLEGYAPFLFGTVLIYSIGGLWGCSEGLFYHNCVEIAEKEFRCLEEPTDSRGATIPAKIEHCNLNNSFETVAEEVEVTADCTQKAESAKDCFAQLSCQEFNQTYTSKVDRQIGLPADPALPCGVAFQEYVDSCFATPTN